MGKKRFSPPLPKTISHKLPTTAPKDDLPPTTTVTKDDEKPSSSPRPEEDKVDEQEDEDLSSASSSSEAEEDDEEDDSPSKNTTPPVISRPNPKTEDDSDSEDDGEETDSDSEDGPVPKLKSLNSNSKPYQIKSKVEPKPLSAPARSGTKRPVDNHPNQAKKRKTATAAEKEPEEDNKKSGDDSKKLFQRVFNEDDEMAIMKGLYDFITKTENDPFKYHSAFYEFVKKSIHFKVTMEQLKDKIRRLKLKYETKAKSKKAPKFSKETDRIMFEYGQKIWGGKLNVNEAEEKGKPNGKLSKREPAAKKPRTTKKLVLEPDSPTVVKETRKVEITDRENHGPSLALSELIRFDESVSVSGETVGAMKRGVELMEESDREELKKRWEKVRIAELEVFKMRAELAVDQAMFILDTLKSSSSD